MDIRYTYTPFASLKLIHLYIIYIQIQMIHVKFVKTEIFNPNQSLT